MTKENFKTLIIIIAVIVVIFVGYGLMTMKEKRGIIEDTGAIQKLYPPVERTGDRP